MSTEADAPVEPQTRSPAEDGGRRRPAGRWSFEPGQLDRYVIVVAVVVVAQAIWLGVLMARGWYYQDDLAFLSQAQQHHLGPGYLTSSVNDHLTPGLRLGFWLLRPLGLAHYGVTIAVRLVLQAAATGLLYRLMVELVGRRPLVLGVLAGYAVSPFLLGMVWLSAAVNVLPAQLLVLVGVLAHVRYVRGGRLRLALGAGLAFGAAATFLELSGIDLVLLVPLALGFGYEGPARERFAALRRQWAGWVLVALPVAAFALAYVAGGYGGSARTVHTGTLSRLAWDQWTRTVATQAVGGPWRWFSTRDVYFGATDPPSVAVWLTQALVVVVVVASVRRHGLQALVAWSLPLGFVLLSSTILTIGRFGQFGYLSARVITYTFGAAVPCALAVLLAFAGPPRVAAAGRPVGARRAGGTRWAGRSRLRRAGPVALGATLVALLAGAVVSGIRFTDRWAQNPTRAYVTTLRRELADHPAARLFDTPLPLRVLPFVEPNRYLSDIVPLLGEPASFAPGTSGDLVDQHGHVVPATFLPAAQLAPTPPGQFCAHLVTGRTGQQWTLSAHPSRNEWFLRLDYFQQHPSVLHVALLDARGRVVAPVAGSTQLLDSTLATRYLRFPQVAPVAVRVTSESPATNVCLSSVQVGYPFPTAGDR